MGDYNREYEILRNKEPTRKRYLQEYYRTYCKIWRQKNPEKAKAIERRSYLNRKEKKREYYLKQREKTLNNLHPSILIARWQKVAKDLLSTEAVPTPKDNVIIGLLAYMMNIAPIELIKFLTGMQPTKKALKQIKQWLDFREQIVLEEELPPSIRERHKLVNANYERITKHLDELGTNDKAKEDTPTTLL